MFPAVEAAEPVVTRKPKPSMEIVPGTDTSVTVNPVLAAAKSDAAQGARLVTSTVTSPAEDTNGFNSSPFRVKVPTVAPRRVTVRVKELPAPKAAEVWIFSVASTWATVPWGVEVPLAAVPLRVWVPVPVAND